MFDGFSTIQDLGAYENEIFNALQEYCDDREDYDKDVILAINPTTLSVKVDTRNMFPKNFDMYEVDTLLLGNEPDYDAIHDLATNYIFVR